MKRIFDRILLEVFAGMEITKVAEQSLAICSVTDCPVDFIFNGIHMRVYYNSTVNIIVSKYSTALKKQSEIIECSSTS